MDNLTLLALYIPALIGGINPRFGLLKSLTRTSSCGICPKCRTLRRKTWKNRRIWLFGYLVRVFVLFVIAWVILHFGWIQINSRWALFCWGVPYVWIAWFLNVFATWFEENCIFHMDFHSTTNSDVSGFMSGMWAVCLVVLLVIYVAVRVFVWSPW